MAGELQLRVGPDDRCQGFLPDKHSIAHYRTLVNTLGHYDMMMVSSRIVQEGVMEDEFLSVDGMAEEFSVSRSTAWKWIRDHEIETFRFIGDRKTYVRRADIAALRQPIPIDAAKKGSAAHKLAA